jgi:hypothetical protein
VAFNPLYFLLRLLHNLCLTYALSCYFQHHLHLHIISPFLPLPQSIFKSKLTELQAAESTYNMHETMNKGQTPMDGPLELSGQYNLYLTPQLDSSYQPSGPVYQSQIDRAFLFGLQPQDVDAGNVRLNTSISHLPFPSF